MKSELVLDGKNYISASRASEITGYNADYISQLCRKSILDSRMVGRSWFVNKDALNNYKQNPTPSHNQPQNFSEEVLVGTPQVSFFSQNQEPTSFFESNSKSTDSRKFLNKVGTVFVAVLLFVAAASNIDFLGRTISDTPTTLSYSANVLQSVGESIQEKTKNALDVISLGLEDVRDLFAEHKSVKSLVVLPSTEDESLNDEIKNYVKKSFSDEVVVEPDKSGESGLIRPVFRSGDDQEYLYVMVPVIEN